MAVGPYYGIRFRDAVKFFIADTSFVIEKKIGDFHRSRVQRAAAESRAIEEMLFSMNNTAANENINSEEVIAASKEAPVEEPGAEKMENNEEHASSEDPIVGDIGSADQQSGQKPVEGLDIAGAHFDLDMGPIENVEPSILQESIASAQQNMFQHPFVQSQSIPVQQPMTGAVQMNVPSGSVPPVTSQQPGVAQQNYTFPQQPPIHRVDAPPKVIQPKPPRAEADHVEVGNINVAQPFVDPNRQNRVIRDQHPEIIQKDTPHIQDKPSEQLYDNSMLIAAFPYLGEIQRVALKHHIQLKMEMLGYAANPMIQSGMVLCYAFNDGTNVFNDLKSFTIDTGNIIDRRPKLFAGIVINGFEDMPAYAIQINDKINKNKNNFDEELFENIFVGGVTMLDGRGMYTPQYRKLNKIVDLSTMPTKLMNGERRKAVQDRLMKALNAGVFNKALKMAPGSRFEFKENSYDKDRGTFVLTNCNVPIAFNGPIANTIPTEISFKTNSQVFIHSPNNPPADTVPETTKEAEAPKQEKKQKNGSKKSNKKQNEDKVEAEAPAETSSSDAANTGEN